MGEPDDRGPGRVHATATLMAAGPAVVLPVLAVEAATGGGPADVEAWMSRLASSGLTRLVSVIDVPSRPAGWAVRALFLGLDRIHVVVRSPGPEDFYAGTCAVTDGWRELVAETGTCVLLAGCLGLNDVLRADLSPHRVRQMADAAGGAGLLAGGLIPVLLPSQAPGHEVGFRMRPVGFGERRRPPTAPQEDFPPFPHAPEDLIDSLPDSPPPFQGSGFPRFRPPDFPFDSIADDDPGEPDEPADHLNEALKAVRSTARGMSREQVRRRLVAELLGRGEMPPSRTVDHYVDDIMLGDDIVGKERRRIRRRTAAAGAGWRVLRSVEAIMLHRPVPHWHVMGIHRVIPDRQGQRLEVVVGSGAAKWLAVGEADAIEVWFGTADQDARSPGGDAPYAVYRGDERVGVLGADADAAYRPILLEACRAGVIVTATAIRSRALDGSWRLRVCYPAQGARAIIQSFMTADG